MDKNKLKRLADYAVREGTEHTTDGRWSVSYDELYYHFGEEITDANENGKLLEEELRQREEINELIMTEDRDDLSSGTLSELSTGRHRRSSEPRFSHGL